MSQSFADRIITVSCDNCCEGFDEGHVVLGAKAKDGTLLLHSRVKDGRDLVRLVALNAVGS